MAIIRVHAVDYNAKIVRVFVAKSGEIRGPRPSYGCCSYNIFKEYVSGGYEGHKVS
jgi:hypothetical protein